jgi:hyperosmotically inducible protein
MLRTLIASIKERCMRKTMTMVALAGLAAMACSPKQEAPAAEAAAQHSEPVDPMDMDLPSERAENRQPLPHQAEKESDRTITQQIRQLVFKEDDLSRDAKNVRIVTVDGVVTLRGPVQTEAERAEIDSVAKRIDGVKRVDNQLEIATN